jgi:hypothetical protein
MLAAAAPSSNCRIAPRQNGRLVSSATTPPPATAAMAARTRATHNRCRPHRYGSSGTSAPTANDAMEAPPAT